MRWKVKNKKTSDGPSQVVAHTDKKFRWQLQARKILALAVALVLLGAGLWYFKSRDNDSAKNKDIGAAPEINLAEETAKFSTEGYSDQQKYEFYRGLAGSYLSRAEYGTAADYFMKASEFTNDDSRLFIDAANSYFYAGNKSKAADVAKKALELIDKKSAENFEQIGDLYAYSDDKPEAKAFYDRAVQYYQGKTELDGELSKEEVIDRIESKIEGLD